MKFRLICVLLFISSVIFAQDPDKESIGFRCIRAYPKLNIPPGVKSFAITDENYVTYNSDSPIGSSLHLQIAGFKQVANPKNAEVIIMFKNVQEALSDIVILDDRHKLVNGPKGKKMKPAAPKLGPDGKPIKEFKGEATKETSFSYQIEMGNEIIYSDNIHKVDHFETSWLPSPHAAKDAILKLTKDAGVAKEVKKLKNEIKSLIGSDILANIKLDIFGAEQKKKTPHDYTELNNSIIQFETAAEYLKEDEFNTEPFKEEVEKIVALWEILIKESDLTNKNAKVNAELTAALYYNIAIYNILIKDFSTAESYFKLSNNTYKGFKDALEMAVLAKRWNASKVEYEKRMNGK